MNTIGIDHNLNRQRIRKLLIFGVIGSVLTGIGDFLLGYGEQVSADTNGLAEMMMANALNLSDAQLIWGGLLGVIGLFLEGLACFAIYRLMADSSQKYAHIYRASIIGYFWLAPVGCHMNVGLMNYAYKRLLLLDAAVASEAANGMIWAFCVPLWVLLIAFWLPGMITQFKAFARGYTPYPARAKWFSVLVGMWPALIIAAIVGPGSALGGGIGTMFLSFGNLFMFGGLLATLPDQKRFEQFEASLPSSLFASSPI